MNSPKRPPAGRQPGRGPTTTTYQRYAAMGSRPAHSRRPNKTRSPNVTRGRQTPRSYPLPHNTLSWLRQMRTRLETVRAIVHLSSATLRAQQSDADMDVALILQRSVGDVLDREIETLDDVVAGRVAELQTETTEGFVS